MPASPLVLRPQPKTHSRAPVGQTRTQRPQRMQFDSVRKPGAVTSRPAGHPFAHFPQSLHPSSKCRMRTKEKRLKSPRKAPSGQTYLQKTRPVILTASQMKTARTTVWKTIARSASVWPGVNAAPNSRAPVVA